MGVHPPAAHAATGRSLTVNAQVRAALPADVPAMAEIDGAVSPSPWSAAQLLDVVSGLDCPGASSAAMATDFALVAERAGAVLGFVICQRVLDELSVHNVAVAPVAQRQGLASQLLEAALAEMTGAIRRCVLEVRASNTAALALYRQLGFVEDGRRRNYYPTAQGREDAVLMSLQPGELRERA